MSSLTGGCLCGAVRFRIETQPLAQLACHCRDCQYVAGGAEANVLAVPRAAVSLLSGEEKAYHSRAASGAAVWRSFCPTCGTPLFAGGERHPDIIAVKAGTLDDPEAFRRQGHIWTASAPSWHLMEPDRPRADRNPDVG